MNKYFIVSLLLSLVQGEEAILGENSCRVLIDAHDRAAMMSRSFIGGQSNRWPNGVVPYTISAAFSVSQRSVIMDSMKHISDRTCVTFVERTSETNYVDIYTGESGCFANLGYNSQRARSVLHLQSNGCVFNGVVIHELLHILGMDHEQNRFDRDEYVTINWPNVQAGTYNNFWRALGENEADTLPYCGNVGLNQYDNCHGGFRASTFGISYDYGSVMHYGLDFFTNNGQDTIALKKQTTINIPNRVGMSDLDAQKTRAAYQCQTSESTTVATSTNAPESTTDAPESTTDAPESTTDAPESTTDEPESTTDAPESTTDAPETTTDAPETTNTMPETTTSGCSDTWEYCSYYPEYCGKNKFVDKRCKKTCNTCGEASCKDTWRWCENNKDLCGRNDFVNRRCKKTCFNCECKNRIADESCVVLSDYCRFRFIKRVCAKECGTC